MELTHHTKNIQWKLVMTVHLNVGKERMRRELRIYLNRLCLGPLSLTHSRHVWVLPFPSCPLMFYLWPQEIQNENRTCVWFYFHPFWAGWLRIRELVCLCLNFLIYHLKIMTRLTGKSENKTKQTPNTCNIQEALRPRCRCHNIYSETRENRWSTQGLPQNQSYVCKLLHFHRVLPINYHYCCQLPNTENLP